MRAYALRHAFLLNVGTGKTALARAAAATAKATFLVVNGPDVVAEHLGESEQCIKGIFAASKSLAPSVSLFLHGDSSFLRTRRRLKQLCSCRLSSLTRLMR